MNSHKATYWFAVALAALAFHSAYTRGGFPGLHHAADTASVAVCHLTSGAERAFAMARLGVKGPVVSDDELPMSVEIQPFVDARQLSHEQREMIRERVRAQVEAARAEVMAHRDELRELSQQVHFIDSMNRRVIVIGQGNGKSKVEISGLPDLPSIDDDDDSY